MADPGEDSPTAHDGTEPPPSNPHDTSPAYPWGIEGGRYLEGLLEEYAPFLNDEMPADYQPFPTAPGLGWPPLPTYARYANTPPNESEDPGEDSSSMPPAEPTSDESEHRQQIPHSYDRSFECRHGVVVFRRCRGPHDTCDVCGRIPAIGWIYRCAVDNWDAEYDEIDVPFLSPWIHQAINDGHYTPDEIERLYLQKIEVLKQAAVARGENVVETLRQNDTRREVDADAAAEAESSKGKGKDQGVPLDETSPNTQYANADGKPSRIVDQEKKQAQPKQLCYFKCCNNCRSDWVERVWYVPNQAADYSTLQPPTPHLVMRDPAAEVNVVRLLLVDHPPQWMYSDEESHLCCPALWSQTQPEICRLLQAREEKHHRRNQERREMTYQIRMDTIFEESSTDEEVQEQIRQGWGQDVENWPIGTAAGIYNPEAEQAGGSAYDDCRSVFDSDPVQPPPYGRVVDAADFGAWMNDDFDEAGPSTYVPREVSRDMGLGMDFETFAEIPSPVFTPDKFAEEFADESPEEYEVEGIADEASTEYPDAVEPLPEEYIMQSSANGPKGKEPVRNSYQDDTTPTEANSSQGDTSSTEEAETSDHNAAELLPEEYTIQSSEHGPKGKEPARNTPEEDTSPSEGSSSQEDASATEEAQTSDPPARATGLRTYSVDPLPQPGNQGPVNQSSTYPVPSGYQLTDDDWEVSDLMSEVGFQPLFWPRFKRD